MTTTICGYGSLRSQGRQLLLSLRAKRSNPDGSSKIGSLRDFAFLAMMTRSLPGRLRLLAAAVAGRLIGAARVVRAVGQAGQRLAAAEEEFRAGGIADRPVAGGLVQLQQRSPLAHRHHIA